MTAKLTEARFASVRRDLSETATDLFLKDGMRGLTMRRLADAAGISRSTPYTYFRDKNAVIDSIRAAGYDRLTKRYREVIADEKDLLSRLRRCACTYVEFALAEPSIYRLMTDQVVDNAVCAPVLAAARDEFLATAGPLLQDCIDAGVIIADRRELQMISTAAIHGLIHLFFSGHITSAAELRRHVVILLDMMERSVVDQTSDVNQMEDVSGDRVD